MKMTMEELRRAVDKLMDQIDDFGMREIDFKTDFYWNIAGCDRDASGEKPRPVIVVGSIDDDVECIRNVLTEEVYYMTTDIERIGNILITLGEEILAMDCAFLPGCYEEKEQEE